MLLIRSGLGVRSINKFILIFFCVAISTYAITLARRMHSCMCSQNKRRNDDATGNDLN